MRTLERDRAMGTGFPYVLIGRGIYQREEDIAASLTGLVRRRTSEPAQKNMVTS